MRQHAVDMVTYYDGIREQAGMNEHPLEMALSADVSVKLAVYQVFMF